MNEERVRVLVVNDDAALARSVRSLLVETGYDVEVAVDGADGLATLSRWRADVVLLDLLMPRLDGWGFLTAVGKNEHTHQPPVVVWSVASDEELERAPQLGAVECLPRSKTGPMQLLEAIERHAPARPAVQPGRGGGALYS